VIGTTARPTPPLLALTSKLTPNAGTLTDTGSSSCH
jgi:hypothetical protein